MSPTAADPRQRLTERMDVLLGREARIAKHLRGQDGRHDADSGDVGSYTNADEVLEGLEEAALQEIGQIETALLRLDAGTYGICVTCGAAQQEARLAVLPHAPECVGCAAKA